MSLAVVALVKTISSFANISWNMSVSFAYISVSFIRESMYSVEMRFVSLDWSGARHVEPSFSSPSLTWQRAGGGPEGPYSPDRVPLRLRPTHAPRPDAPFGQAL